MKRPPHDSGLPIFHATYQLLVVLSEYTDTFPKKDRYTSGERLRVLGLDFLALIIRANYARGSARAELLTEASVTFDILKVMLRLAKDTKALPEKRYLLLIERSHEIGKMLGGWLKSARQ